MSQASSPPTYEFLIFAATLFSSMIQEKNGVKTDRQQEWQERVAQRPASGLSQRLLA